MGSGSSSTEAAMLQPPWFYSPDWANSSRENTLLRKCAFGSVVGEWRQMCTVPFSSMISNNCIVVGCKMQWPIPVKCLPLVSFTFTHIKNKIQFLNQMKNLIALILFTATAIKNCTHWIFESKRTKSQATWTKNSLGGIFQSHKEPRSI